MEAQLFSETSFVCSMPQTMDSIRHNTGWSKSLCTPDSVYSNNSHKIGDMKMTITKHIPNVDRAILKTVFENTVRRVDKCLETAGGHFECYL
jgi:hypothetical protein